MKKILFTLILLILSSNIIYADDRKYESTLFEEKINNIDNEIKKISDSGNTNLEGKINKLIEIIKEQQEISKYQEKTKELNGEIIKTINTRIYVLHELIFLFYDDFKYYFMIIYTILATFIVFILEEKILSIFNRIFNKISIIHNMWKKISEGWKIAIVIFIITIPVNILINIISEILKKKFNL